MLRSKAKVKAKERTNPEAARAKIKGKGKDKVNPKSPNHLSKATNHAGLGRRMEPVPTVTIAGTYTLINRKQGGSPLLRLLSPAPAIVR